MFGGEKGGLPEHRLLSNCARAVHSGVGVISKMHEILTRTSPEHAEHFNALMTSERCSQYFMQLTLGDAVLVTDENSRELYSALESITGEKITKKKDEEIAQIRKSHEEKLNETANKIAIEKDQEKNLSEEQLLRQVSTKSDELDFALSESIKYNLEAKQAQQTLDAERIANEKQKLAIINDALHIGKARRKSIRLYTIIVSTIVLFLLM